jgi:crotonobetainyl-CoA:carnitine CoA-transferase CaiB-like acyl-CoA transferase
MLADFGATVIRVESPEGSENRRWPPMSHEGWSASFTSVNRGKRSMALNLKNPGALAVLRDLAAGADKLIHSFLPDTAARFMTHPQVLANDLHVQARNADGSIREGTC